MKRETRGGDRAEEKGEWKLCNPNHLGNKKLDVKHSARILNLVRKVHQGPEYQQGVHLRRNPWNRPQWDI